MSGVVDRRGHGGPAGGVLPPRGTAPAAGRARRPGPFERLGEPGRRSLGRSRRTRRYDYASSPFVVGKSPEKMGEALGVLRSAGFVATGAFERQKALAAIAAHDRLLAVVAGGSVDEQLEADLRAATEPTGGKVVRAYIGHEDPAQHFRDHVLPQLDQLVANQGRER